MFINLEYSNANTKKILIQMGILLDGMYRENTITSDIYDYIQIFVVFHHIFFEDQLIYLYL
jgi:hypothetical protein